MIPARSVKAVWKVVEQLYGNPQCKAVGAFIQKVSRKVKEETVKRKTRCIGRVKVSGTPSKHDFSKCYTRECYKLRS